MGHNVHESMINNITRRAINGIETAFLNLLAGIEELVELKTRRKIRNNIKKIALMNTSFEQKVDDLYKLIKESDGITDDGKKIALDYIDRIREKYINRPASEGFDDIRKTLTKFSNKMISQEDKLAIKRIIKSCTYELNDPCQIKVNANQYNVMMRLIRKNGLSDLVTPLVMNSGEYLLLFDSSISKDIEKYAMAAGHDYGLITHPTKNDIATQAFLEATDKSKASLLVIENVPPELAEKAAIESSHVGEITFSKVPRENGNFDLVCVGGETKEDRNKKYTEAMKIMALSAYAITGQVGEVERPHMRHSSNEYAKIEKVLDCIEDPAVQEEDSGYVYSIHTMQKNGQEFIIPNDYVKFDRDSFTCTKNDKTTLPIRATERPDDYRQVLERTIKSGTGQKVYISNSRMEQLKAEAKRIMSLYEPGKNRMDLMDELTSKISDLLQQRASEQSSSIQLSIDREIRQTRIAINAMVMNPTAKEISEDMVMDRVIAAELEAHKFRMPASKEKMESIDSERRLSRWCINNYKITLENKSDILPGGNIETTDTRDARRILSSINPDRYISYEQELENDKDYKGPIPTKESIAKDSIVYKENKSHIEAASKVLDGITIHIEKAMPLSIELQLMDTSASQERARRRNLDIEEPANEKNLPADTRRDRSFSRDI